MDEGRLDGARVCEIGMAMAVEHLLRSGFAVAIPIVDEGYDLLVSLGRRHWRVQVKSTSSDGPNGYRVRLSRGSGRRSKYKHDGTVDAFIAVHVDRDAIVCMSSKEAAGRNWLSFTDDRRRTHGGVSHLRDVPEFRRERRRKVR